MSGTIGSTPQIQPNIIQNSVQKNAQQSVQRDAQKPSAENTQVNQNQNFQKLAQDIIAQRTSSTEVSQQAAERGQVVDLLV